MGVTKKLFGKIQNEKDVFIYTLKNSNGLSVDITNYGGTIISILVPNKHNDLIDIALGYDNLEDYLKGDKFFGALIGRFANRIQSGKFSLNDKEYVLAKNDGENHLHGGKKGFDKVVWDVEIFNTNSLKLSYYSKDGEEGYPGNLNVKVTYVLTDDNRLEINYFASTDQDTIINLTNHSYFNLSGHNSGHVLNQKLMINADKFTVNDKYSIPTSEIKNVEGTPMDFTKLIPIGTNIDSDYNQITWGMGFDHNWVLNTNGSLNEKAAEAIDENSGIIIDMYTTAPGVQFYTGNFLDGSDIGKNGAIYNCRNGFCLETQYFPNSINCDKFASPVLKAGETYNHKTIYKFSTL